MSGGLGVDRAQDRPQPGGDSGSIRPAIRWVFQVTASSGRRSSRRDNWAGPRTGHAGTSPSGRIERRTPSVAVSVQIRSSRACQSMATRRRSRHCLITNGGSPGTSTRNTIFETPPASSRTRISASAGTCPEVAQVVGRGLGVDFTHGWSYARRVVPLCQGLFLAPSLATNAACSGLARPRWRAACTAGKSPRIMAAGSSQRPGKMRFDRDPIHRAAIPRTYAASVRTSRSRDHSLARQDTLGRRCAGRLRV